MIYLPWIAFFLAVGWMIQQGFKEKKRYVCRKAEAEEERARSTAYEDALVKTLRVPGPQSQRGDLGNTLGGQSQSAQSSRMYN